MEEKMIQQQATLFSEEYIADVSVDLVKEILHLKAIHTDNIGKDVLPPHHLLNRLAAENLEGLFPNVCVALRIFCTLPVSVAGAERSHSKKSLSYFKKKKTYFERNILKIRENFLGEW